MIGLLLFLTLIVATIMLSTMSRMPHPRNWVLSTLSPIATVQPTPTPTPTPLPTGPPPPRKLLLLVGVESVAARTLSFLLDGIRGGNGRDVGVNGRNESDDQLFERGMVAGGAWLERRDVGRLEKRLLTHLSPFKQA